MGQRLYSFFISLIIMALTCLLLAEAQDTLPGVDSDIRGEMRVMADIIGEIIG